jgi:hypothetical protein
MWRLALVVLVACGGAPGAPGGPGAPDGPTLSDARPPTPIQLAGIIGTYSIRTSIRLGGKVPSSLQPLYDDLKAFTFEGPGTWLLDLMARDQSLAPVLTPLRPTVDQGVANLVGERIGGGGIGLGSVWGVLLGNADHFELEEHITIARADSGLVASHEVWAINVHLYDRAQLLDPSYLDQTLLAKVDGVPVTIDGDGIVTFAEHTLLLSYPGILRYVLRDAVEHAYLNADTMRQLIADSYNCAAIAPYLVKLGGLDETTWENACSIAVLDGTDGLYADLDPEVALPSSLTISGHARAFDRDGDGLYNDLNDGTWQAQLTVGTSSLYFEATFDDQ